MNGLNSKQNKLINSSLPRQCNRSGCPDPTDQRHILDVEGRDNSVNMCHFIHAIVPRHVETVVQLSKGERSSTPLRVEPGSEDVDFASLREDATYPQIKNYVQEHFGLKVTSLQIAQTKRKLGLPIGDNYNLSKKENQVIPNCPPEKKAAIRDALRHFSMM